MSLDGGAMGRAMNRTRLRQLRHEPIVHVRSSKPPAWIVSCRDCAFRHDAHGANAQQAVKSITGHQVGHRLVAEPVDYTTGYGPDKTDPHPLY